MKNSKKDELRLESSGTDSEGDPVPSHEQQLGMSSHPPSITVNGKTIQNGYAQQAKRIKTLGDKPKESSVSKKPKAIQKDALQV